MTRNIPKATSSRRYTAAYVDAWADNKEIQNVDAWADNNEIQNIFLYFPNLEELLQGKQVLDIGCNHGTFVHMLRSRGIDAVGIDLFAEPNSPFQFKGDFMSYAFDKKFDAIFGLGVFEKAAIYSPVFISSSQDKMEFKRKSLEQNPPQLMLRRFNELLAVGGFGILSIYTSPLIFSSDVASEEGFKLIKYVRTLNTDKFPKDESSVVFSPETMYVFYRKK